MGWTQLLKILKFIIRNTIREWKANPKLFWKVINELHTINITELYEYVNSLRRGSAPGYNRISADFIKNNFNTLKTPLLLY